MAEEDIQAQIREEQAAIRMARAQQYYGDLRARSNAMQSMPTVHPLAAVAATQQQHFGHMNSAINQTNSAIANEMQSRVNQQREARRLEHEKEMMRMKAQSDIYGAAIRSLLS